MTKILLVDDDVQIAELIDVYVKNDGYRCLGWMGLNFVSGCARRAKFRS